MDHVCSFHPHLTHPVMKIKEQKRGRPGNEAIRGGSLTGQTLTQGGKSLVNFPLSSRAFLGVLICIVMNGGVAVAFFGMLLN